MDTQTPPPPATPDAEAKWWKRKLWKLPVWGWLLVGVVVIIAAGGGDEEPETVAVDNEPESVAMADTVETSADEANSVGWDRIQLRADRNPRSPGARLAELGSENTAEAAAQACAIVTRGMPRDEYLEATDALVDQLDADVPDWLDDIRDNADVELMSSRSHIGALIESYCPVSTDPPFNTVRMLCAESTDFEVTKGSPAEALAARRADDCPAPTDLDAWAEASLQEISSVVEDSVETAMLKMPGGMPALRSIAEETACTDEWRDADDLRPLAEQLDANPSPWLEDFTMLRGNDYSTDSFMEALRGHFCSPSHGCPGLATTTVGNDPDNPWAPQLCIEDA